MSLQSDIFTMLSSTFSTRVYPMTAPPEVVVPFVIYSRISSTEQATLDTNGGTGNSSNTRAQIDIYASTYSDAQAKAASVKALLKTWTVENIIEGEQDFYESDTKLYRVMIDLSTWHN